MKKILITGVGGFVGHHIANCLYENDYQIMGIVRKKRKSYRLPVIEQDLSLPFDLVESFDIIVHVAGRLPCSSDDFNLFKRDNIDSMVNLIELAKRKKIKKFIYLSTIGVHGEFRESIINEKSDMINPDFYGITKYMAELLLKAEPSIQSISLRMPGIIGKDAKNVWLTNLVEKLRKNEDVVIYSPEFETKNFVHVSDLSRFIDILLKKENYEKNTVTLACSQGVKIIDMVRYIKNRVKSRSIISVDDRIRKPFCLDNRSAIAMGYQSMSPFELIDRYLEEERLL